MIINNHQVARAESIKFLGVLLDENLSWKEHIKYTENKIAKNIGLLYRAKPFLNKKCLLSLYFSYIHSYINYANIAWGSTYLTNLKKINSQQKHAFRIIYNKKKFESARELLKLNKTLNVYKLNILNTLVLMHKIKTNTAPTIFRSRFKRPSHKYTTRFSEFNYTMPKHKLSLCKHAFSVGGAYLWNKFLTSKEKKIELVTRFQQAIKSKLLAIENEISYF